MMELNGPPAAYLCKWDEPQCVTVQAVDPARVPLPGGADVTRWFTAERGRPVTGTTPVVRVRDSKLGDASPVVEFTSVEWRAFTTLLPLWRAAGEGDDLHYALGGLRFDPLEFGRFRTGVETGAFDVLGPEPRDAGALAAADGALVAAQR